VQESVKKAYAALLTQLYALSPNLDRSPVILDLSPNAKALFIEWHDKHCAEAETQLCPRSCGASRQAEGYAPRLALIHALATNPHATQIEEGSIGAAVDLVEYSKPKRNVSPHCSAVTLAPLQLDANRVSGGPMLMAGVCLSEMPNEQGMPMPPCSIRSEDGLLRSSAGPWC
jgi:hypothetical protein